MYQEDPVFKGTIGKTVQESEPWWADSVPSSKDAPNVAVILLDDLGFAQLGCYGSDISTPNIDALAENGLRYNNFHTAAMCSPSRASLLTGRNPHSTGVSFVTELDTGFPNCTGKVRKDTAMISEMFQEAGYNTFAVGKWHLNPAKEQTNIGPFDGWPLGRGFEQFYGFLRGGTSQFYPDLVEGNKRIPQPKSPEEGYHLTEDLTDKAIEYVQNQKSEDPNKPFFAYLSYAAPHAPLHAPRKYIEKYKGKYDRGWDKVREEWFHRQKELGIIPEHAELPPSNPGVKAWAELNKDEQRLFARMQEVFSGYVEHTDYHIGRFINSLKEMDQFENTLIIFMSDNGACAMGGDQGMVHSWEPSANVIEETFEEKLAQIDKIGGPESEAHYPAGWAQAGNTPLKWYKTYTHEGGVRSPLIIHYPKEIKNKGGIRTQYHHIVDIVPTILELTGTKALDVYKGVVQKPIHGQSLAYTFDRPDQPTVKRIQHFEIASNRGIWKNGWKAVAQHKANTSFNQDEWELYDTKNDFSEYDNLANKYPEKLKEMIDDWWIEAEKYDVFPLDGRTLPERLKLFQKKNPREEGPVKRVFYNNPSMFHNSIAPDIRNMSFEMDAEIYRLSTDCNGVIVAHGNQTGGYTIFIKNNQLYFDYNVSGQKHFIIKGSNPLPSGHLTVGFHMVKQDDGYGIGKLFVNNKEIAREKVGYLSGLGYSRGMFCLGCNANSSISEHYRAPFYFNGQISKVTYTLDRVIDDTEERVIEEMKTE